MKYQITLDLSANAESLWYKGTNNWPFEKFSCQIALHDLAGTPGTDKIQIIKTLNESETILEEYVIPTTPDSADVQSYNKVTLCEAVKFKFVSDGITGGTAVIDLIIKEEY